MSNLSTLVNTKCGCRCCFVYTLFTLGSFEGGVGINHLLFYVLNMLFPLLGGNMKLKTKQKHLDRTVKPLVIFLGCAFPYRALKISLTKLHIGPEEQEQHLISAARAAVSRTPHSYRAVQRCSRVEDEERPYTPMPVKLGGEY